MAKLIPCRTNNQVAATDRIRRFFVFVRAVSEVHRCFRIEIRTMRKKIQRIFRKKVRSGRCAHLIFTYWLKTGNPMRKMDEHLLCRHLGHSGYAGAGEPLCNRCAGHDAEMEFISAEENPVGEATITGRCLCLGIRSSARLEMSCGSMSAVAGRSL